MPHLKKTEENKHEDKINVSLKRDTICLLDEVARRKVDQAIKNGSLDIINLIRSKRGRGVSYNSQINYLARIYLAVLDESCAFKNDPKISPQLKEFIKRLSEINNFFLKHEGREEKEEDDEEDKKH